MKLMIKLIFSLIFMSFFTSTQGMNTPHFEIINEDLSVTFSPIDLHNLSTDNKNKFINLLGNPETFEILFGKDTNIESKDFFSWYLNLYNTKVTKMPENTRFEFHWFLEDKDTNDLIGYFTVTTCVNKLEDYKGQILLDLGLVIHPDYRGKRYVSKLAESVLKKIRSLNIIPETALFCFNTLSANKVMHILAEKFGAIKQQFKASRKDNRTFFIFKNY